MELTTEERNVLAHVVIDPDAWVKHAVATVGESAVYAKIARWKPDYETALAKGNYKTRAQREAA